MRRLGTRWLPGLHRKVFHKLRFCVSEADIRKVVGSTPEASEPILCALGEKVVDCNTGPKDPPSTAVRAGAIVWASPLTCQRERNQDINGDEAPGAPSWAMQTSQWLLPRPVQAAPSPPTSPACDWEIQGGQWWELGPAGCISLHNLRNLCRTQESPGVMLLDRGWGSPPPHTLVVSEPPEGGDLRGSTRGQACETLKLTHLQGRAGLLSPPPSSVKTLLSQRAPEKTGPCVCRGWDPAYGPWEHLEPGVQQRLEEKDRRWPFCRRWSRYCARDTFNVRSPQEVEGGLAAGVRGGSDLVWGVTVGGAGRVLDQGEPHLVWLFRKQFNYGIFQTHPEAELTT